MLTISLHTYDGHSYRLPTLLSWDLRYTASVPCDSMEAACLYNEEMAEVLPKATRFTAGEEGKIVLNGVVDAYEVSLSTQGLLLTIEGRGMAALLLDNESEAVTYGGASLEEILARHVRPYGLRAVAQVPVYGRNYAVSAGSSQWKALWDFTRRFGGFMPYFRPDGTLVAAPLSGSGRTFSVGDDDPVLSLSRREQRYGVISEMLIIDKVQGVRHRVENPDFLRTGGQRRHILYMPRSTERERRYTGEYQIEQSEQEHREIRLTLPLPFAAFPGDRAALSLTRLGLNGIFDVAEAHSRMNENGEICQLTLKG